MRVIYFITGFTVGGAEIVTIGIANKMCEKGHKVTIVYLTGENQLVQRISPGVRVIPLHMPKNAKGFVKAQIEAARLVKMIEPDVIHGNMFHANIFIRILRLHCHIHYLISTEHSNNTYGYIKALLYRLTDWLSNINTNVSQKATDHFINVKAFSKNKSMPMYNGIDTSRFQKNLEMREKIRTEYHISDTDFLFINVGRLTEAKNQSGLINAFYSLSFHYQNVKLIIVGEGELRLELENQIRSLKLDDKVILTGNKDNTPDYYSAADCFVMSSSWEGFGLVLAEAMSCELPVIATDAGGCAEVVVNRDYLVPIDNKEALREKMKMIYHTPLVERIALGINNKVLAQRFDMDTIVNKWITLYRNVSSL